MAHTRFLGWPFVGLVSTQSGMTAAIDQLTEKEKETLRLIVRGHDAKSAATELNLSVHTINERLRSARRKLDVTSSREAARVLYESEAQAAEGTPKKLAYEHLGDAAMLPSSDDPSIRKRGRSPALWIGGIIMMMTSQPQSRLFNRADGKCKLVAGKPGLKWRSHPPLHKKTRPANKLHGNGWLWSTRAIWKPALRQRPQPSALPWTLPCSNPQPLQQGRRSAKCWNGGQSSSLP
ncbi:hypothetical protein EH30_14150 [Erythrobacter sp. JL475]|nr:hypothetical protein EH30_14150 [Erythrobacter sp. JL475]